MQLIGRLFNRDRETSSRSAVKQRLKLVIAHDRAALSPAAVAALRAEILSVVSRYADIDTDRLHVELKNSDRMTSLMADLPIRRIYKALLSGDAADAVHDPNLWDADAPIDGEILELELDFEFEVDSDPNRENDGNPEGDTGDRPPNSAVTEDAGSVTDQETPN